MPGDRHSKTTSHKKCIYKHSYYSSITANRLRVKWGLAKVVFKFVGDITMQKKVKNRSEWKVYEL